MKQIYKDILIAIGLGLAILLAVCLVMNSMIKMGAKDELAIMQKM